VLHQIDHRHADYLARLRFGTHRIIPLPNARVCWPYAGSSVVVRDDLGHAKPAAGSLKL
jgi:hypothetical protein